MLNIILGILLVIVIGLYVKKTMDENDEDIIQNSTIDTDQKMIKAQKLLLLDASNQIDVLNKQLTDAINNVGIVSYGRIGGSIGNGLLVRFLNPKSLITLLMITDELNTNKDTNQTYGEQFEIINNIFTEVITNMRNKGVQAEIQSDINKLKDKYTTQITTNFDTMNNNNRKIANNLLTLDLDKYAIVTEIGFSNPYAIDSDNNGMNISDFINWNAVKKEGTDISKIGRITIVDKRNGDLINPVDMNKRGNVLDYYKDDIILLRKQIQDPKKETNFSKEKLLELFAMEKLLKDLALM
jgi:hypothetical protein